MDIHDILPDIKLHDFPQVNTVLGHPEKGTYAIANIRCPKCKAIDNFYSTQKRRVFGSQYCEGNQPAEHVHQTPFGEKRHLVNCAGIKDEHLHIHCRICDHVSLWELPEVNNG